MKTIRKIAHNPLVLVMMAVALLNLSCNRDDSLEENIEPRINNLSKSYNGEEIFSGLFFFQNNISSEISFLNVYKNDLMRLNNNQDINSELTKLNKISINFIKDRYPNYFNELKRVMYSGNLFEIKRMLITSGKIIEQSLLLNKDYAELIKYGNDISANKELFTKIQQLDLSTTEGQNDLNILLDEYPEYRNGKGKALFFAAVLAVAYVGVAAVSIAVAAYSVVTKVAYIDILDSDDSSLDGNKNLLKLDKRVSDISNYFGHGS